MDASGLVGYVLFCLFGIAFFVQGLALFCAGITAPRAALSQLAYSLVVACAVAIQYYAVGFSLENSSVVDTKDALWSKFTGDLSHVGFKGVDFTSPKAVAELLLRYAFAVVPACLLASAACQRGRLLPLLLFVVVWMTIVYCPVAYWCWHPNGWSRALGVLDYAGGSTIHITSGFGALVYSLVLGPRVAYLAPSPLDMPYSLSFVVRGTMMMWMGWIGFTGGAQVEDGAQALVSVLNTLLSGAMGGFAWMFLDAVAGSGGVHGLQSTQNGVAEENVEMESMRFSLVSFCSGVVSGLVTITPGAGYIPPHAALVFGLLGGLGCNLSTRLKFYIGVDDPLDVFAVHGMGGMLGTLLTGVFAFEKYTTRFQISVQVLSALSVAAYSLGCTLIIALTVDSVPFMNLRISPAQEAVGTDLVEHGESISGLPNREQEWVPSVGGGADRQRFLNPSENVAMYPIEHPMLQRLPLSYGTYTSRYTA